MIDLDFDWLGNPKVAFNVLISALVLSGSIAIGVYGANGGNKATAVAFVGGFLAVLKERMSKKPSELLEEKKLAGGTLLGRRDHDSASIPLQPTEPEK